MRPYNRLLPAMYRTRQPGPRNAARTRCLIQIAKRPARTPRQSHQTTHHNRKPNPNPHKTLLGNSAQGCTPPLRHHVPVIKFP